MPDSAMTIAVGCLVVLFAAAMAGLTGFGFALIAVPVLIGLMPPQVVVPVVLMLTWVIKLLILLEAWGSIELKRFWPLIAAGVAGTPFGTALLLALDAASLKVVIGVVTVFSSLALLLGFRRPVLQEKLVSVPVGFLSGILGGSTAMSGPPTILFLSNQGAQKQVFRANLTVFFAALSMSALATQLVGGLITKTVLAYAAWLLPAVLMGVLVGMRLARRVDEDLFQRVTLIVVLAAGLSAILSGLGLF